MLNIKVGLSVIVYIYIHYFSFEATYLEKIVKCYFVHDIITIKSML